MPVGIWAHDISAAPGHAIGYEQGVIPRGPKRFVRPTSANLMFIHGRAEPFLGPAIMFLSAVLLSATSGETWITDTLEVTGALRPSACEHHLEDVYGVRHGSHVRFVTYNGSIGPQIR